ncbi:hypothetical protein AB6A40_006213 [Gnathostoma spinigerum]|uniref:YitH/HolE acetyltransferase (GNAT) domain-containing protein n=1 Tax=Gnathostoma spinigerum TaxID=75299 RepID=A0ABD6EQC7_9BILA
MAPKYRKRGFPLAGSRLFKYVVSPQSLVSTISKNTDTSEQSWNVLMFSALKQERLLRALLAYDFSVTNRDRSMFLRNFIEHPEVKGCFALNERDEVVGYTAITRTGSRRKNRYKIAPLFANDVTTAKSLLTTLILISRAVTENETIVVYILEDTIGDHIFAQFLDSVTGTERQHHPACGETLFSREPNRIDLIQRDKCFIPHNNCCHFDA